MKQLFQAMLRAMDAGENLVLASVVRTAGSTPRGPGAHMLWSASGPLWGTVGGGPGEAQAMALCRQVLQARTGLTQRFLLGVSDGSPQPPAQALGGSSQPCPPPSETLGGPSPSCQPSAQALGGSPQPCPPPLETLGGPSPSHQPSAQALGGPSQPHQPSAQTGGSQDDSRGQDVGAVCGGEMWVRFQYIACQDAAIGEAAARAVARLEQRLPCWLLLGPLEGGGLWIWDGQTPPPGVPAADLANLPPRPGLIRAGGGLYLAQSLLPRGQVYIFGGGHVAQALVPVLTGVDFRCTVIEDRPQFASPSLFPAAEEVRLLPLDRWLDRIAVTPWDYLCVMTPGHERDMDCLVQALRTPARYIGMMGSRRKVAFMQASLAQRGFAPADIARIHTPIGLPIQAETPAEIAISIAAQLIQVRAQD